MSGSVSAKARVTLQVEVELGSADGLWEGGEKLEALYERAERDATNAVRRALSEYGNSLYKMRITGVVRIEAIAFSNGGQ